MEQPVTIRFRRVSDLARIPTRGSEKAAGYDLYAALDKPVLIEPHKFTQEAASRPRRACAPPTAPAYATRITEAIISWRCTTTATL